MFLRKRKQEDFFKMLEQPFQSLEENLQKTIHESSTAGSQLEELSQQINSLQTAVQKHDMAVEDLLDEWEEKRSDEEDIKKHFQQSEQNEQQLLALFEAYHEQLWNLKRFADARDESWAGQLALIENILEPIRQKCGISLIGECGKAVDYDLHEVIEAIDTEDPGQDRLIAGIYQCGYIYKGTIKKKAKVSAYRTTKNH